MSISIETIAPRDKTRSFPVSIKGDHGGEVEKLPVTYYPNRISLEPLEFEVSEEEKADLTDREITALETAMTLCHYVSQWDLVGPLKNNRGQVIVPDGEPIPLEPRFVQCIPLPVNLAIINQITEHANPNERESRNSRRRSR